MHKLVISAAMLILAALNTAVADVDLSIEASGTMPQNIGELVTYRYTITNLGTMEDATGVLLSVSLASELEVFSVDTLDGTCSVGLTIICTFPLIEQNGGEASLDIVVQMQDFGTFSHTALVVADQTESMPSDNSVQVSTTLNDTRLVSSNAATGIDPIFVFLLVVLARISTFIRIKETT